MVMPVRFGTDGIRGRASDEITVDLAYRLGRAVAQCLLGPDLRGLRHARELATLGGRGVGGTARRAAPRASTWATSRRRASRSSRCSVVARASSCRPRTIPTTTMASRSSASGARNWTTRPKPPSRVRSTSPRVPRPTSSRTCPSTRRPSTTTSITCAAWRPSDLSSLSLVVDCANGAASHVAHELFATTGAQLTMMHDQPDGRNINVDSGRPTSRASSRRCASRARTWASPLTATPTD